MRLFWNLSYNQHSGRTAVVHAGEMYALFVKIPAYSKLESVESTVFSLSCGYFGNMLRYG